MVVQRLNFFQQVDLNGWIPKTDSNKYNSNSSKGCFLEVDLKYPKELHELHNGYYPLAPDKIEIKKYMIKKSMCVFMKTNTFIQS